MQRASMNQLANITNPYQGKQPKILCCCSAGLLRSPTLAKVLSEHRDCNTRAVGTTEGFALIPISEALVRWADQIWFVEHEIYRWLDQEITLLIEELGTTVVILDIPDMYEYNSPELVEIIKKQVFEIDDDCK